MRIRWADTPETHDYTAAKSYLNLFMAGPVAKRIVAGLKRAKVAEFKAKDIFRASALPLLPLRTRT